ncbi:hypothetical protein ABK040_012740 [Willaertia magna]
MTHKLVIKRKKRPSNSSQTSSPSSTTPTTNSFNPSFSFTSFSQPSESNNNDEDEVIEVSPSQQKQQEEIIPKENAFLFPIHFFVRIHRDLILPVIVFDIIRNKKGCSLNDPSISSWFTSSHLEDLQQALKPFLKKQIYEGGNSTLTPKKKKKNKKNKDEEENKEENKECIIIELKNELSTEKTIHLVKSKSIQFTYEFKKNNSSVFLLRRKDTKEEFERVKTKEEVIEILDDSDKEEEEKKKSKTTNKTVHQLDFSDEEEDDIIVVDNNKSNNKVKHNLDFSDEEEEKSSSSILKDLKTQPQDKLCTSILIEETEIMQEITQHEVQLLNDSTISNNTDASMIDDPTQPQKVPYYKKYKDCFSTWKYTLLIYVEPKHKDILDLTTNNKKSSKFF